MHWLLSISHRLFTPNLVSKLTLFFFFFSLPRQNGFYTSTSLAHNNWRRQLFARSGSPPALPWPDVAPQFQVKPRTHTPEEANMFLQFGSTLINCKVVHANIFSRSMFCRYTPCILPRNGLFSVLLYPSTLSETGFLKYHCCAWQWNWDLRRSSIPPYPGPANNRCQLYTPSVLIYKG